MKLIAFAGFGLVISASALTAEPQRELIVPAATPTLQPTPVHTPPPINLRSSEILLQAAWVPPTQQPAPIATPQIEKKDSVADSPLPQTDRGASTNRPIDPDSVVSKAEVIVLVKRIQEQHAQVEANQIKIDQQIADITLMVHQAFSFSRKASQ